VLAVKKKKKKKITVTKMTVTQPCFPVFPVKKERVRLLAALALSTVPRKTLDPVTKPISVPTKKVSISRVFF
jgi:hypothetical protein